jgi:hypothetical protein
MPSSFGTTQCCLGLATAVKSADKKAAAAAFVAYAVFQLVVIQIVIPDSSA